MKSKVYFIGPQASGSNLIGGDCLKNWYIIRRLQSLSVDVRVIDTNACKKSLIQMVLGLGKIVFHRKSLMIVSASSMGAYRILRLLKFLRIKSVCYWVIGGDFPLIINCKYFSIKPYKYIRTIIVEGKRMEETLRWCGLSNVMTLPNFKPFYQIPMRGKPNPNTPVKFVFLSRITEGKGCSYLNKAAKILNNKGYEKSYMIDYYGSIEKKYRDVFMSEINDIPNVQYKGFLELLDGNNYNTLSGYDALVFPTLFYTEGFPGVIVDAFFSGVPVIASDWYLSGDIIKDGVTGVVVANRNEEKLASAMEDVILNRQKYWEMGRNCQMESKKYDINEVITPTLLQEIGINR